MQPLVNWLKVQNAGDYFIYLSPSQGKCCDNTCNFKPQGTVCEQATECSEESTCMYLLILLSGTTSSCFTPMPKNENEFCSDKTALCHQGVLNIL